MDAYYEDGGAVVADPNLNSVIWCGGSYNNGAIRVMSVSRSTNLGSTWQRYSLSPNVGYTYAIAVAPGNSNLIYAGGLEAGAASVYKTTNNGGIWLSSSAGLASDTLYDIAVHPGNNSIVFAATRHGVFKSINSASLWNNKGCSGAKAVLIDPADPTTIYAGTSFGVYKSMDTGETWIPMNAGLGDSCITSLGIYPGEYLFAGTSEQGMYRYHLTPSAVEENGRKTMFSVSVYPNPAAGRVEVNVNLPNPGSVTCSIYDAQGRVVNDIFQGSLPAGVHYLRWNGLDRQNRLVAAGVYMLDLRCGSITRARPIVVVR